MAAQTASENHVAGPLRRFLTRRPGNRPAAEGIEQSTDAIIGISVPDGLVMVWNPAAERMCDYTAGEMVGDSLHILSPPEEQDRSHSVTDAPASGEPVPTFDTVRLRKSGTRVPVAVSTSPIFDAEGEVIGIVTFHSDITERVKAAE
jgi:PAS domain S-box-containing protein